LELRKVILRYLNGGTSPAFAPIFEHGTDPIPGVDPEGRPRWVSLSELKAVFFVRTFSGNPDYDPPRDVTEIPRPPSGRLMQLDFLDGEHIFVDLPEGGADFSHGFFATVLDPEDNNLLLYVNPGALAAPPSFPALQPPEPGTPEALFEP
jgi:hypothetical protein